MKIEGVGSISSYYAFVYNRNTGKIFSDSETDDGFADFYNLGQTQDKEQLSGYTSRKAGIDSLIDFCSRQGVKNNFFNSSDSGEESTIVIENTDSGAVKYYVDGKLLLTNIPGELTSTIKLAPDDTINVNVDNEELEFDDVNSFSISEMDSEENAGPQRKKGTFSQVVTLPDGSRYLITTMYLCGKEIKITKKLPPIDEKEAEEDSLLRQDDEEEDSINIDVQEIERSIENSAENNLLDKLIASYQPENQDDIISMLFEDTE